MVETDPKKDPTYRLTKEGKVYRRGRKVFANLDVYEGEFLDGKKHGKGQLILFNGDIYIGEFENNFMHGHGVFNYTSFYNDAGEMVTGKRYEGGYSENRMHGKGVLQLGFGEVYSGEFENGLYHGRGNMKKRNGDTIVGQFERGKASGKVKMTWVETGNSYEGMMRQGKRHGKGRLTYGGGKGWYEGDWERDNACGQGVRVYSNGGKYVGHFSDGEVHGEGMMLYANGDQYVGNFHRGHLSGRGVLKYVRGDVYDGHFMSGFFFGEGKYTWSDGGYYDGEYKSYKLNKATLLEAPLCNGFRNGFGLRVFTNGSRYQGQWVDDKMDGHGNLAGAGGGKYEGKFHNGFRTGLGREQYGNTMGAKFLCPMGYWHKGDGFCVYMGEWLRDHWHGEGEYRCCDGKIYRGHFEWNRRHGKGFQEYVQDAHAGDPMLNGLYKRKSYDGDWYENMRVGHGTLKYVNGDTLTGPFVQGQPHGLIEVKFARTGRIRYAHFTRGIRTSWVKAKKTTNKAISALKEFFNDSSHNVAMGSDANVNATPPSSPDKNSMALVPAK
jgi:hypothetical protein